MAKAKRKNTTRKARKTLSPKPIPTLCRTVIELQSKADDESLKQSRAYKAAVAAMPKPHPSIVPGPKQDRDGLTLPRGGNAAARFIWPDFIRTVLDNAKHKNPAELIDTVAFLTVRIPKAKPELTLERRALIARLEARLALAQEYRVLYQKRIKAAGIEESKLTRMWDEIADLEVRVARRKSRTWADLAAKVDLYKTERLRPRTV